MPGRLRAVAFDLDGLMFNTERVYDEVARELLERRGKSVDPMVIARMMGRPAPHALQVMIESYQLDDTVDQLIDESQRLFLELISPGVPPMQGLLALLDALEAAGISKSIATSSRPHMVQPLLEGAQLHERFAFTLTADDVANHKPHPEIYATAAARFGITPVEMLVLEDSGVGCQAGVASGACTVAIPSKHAELHDYSGAAFIADSLADPRIYQLLGLNA